MHSINELNCVLLFNNTSEGLFFPPLFPVQSLPILRVKIREPKAQKAGSLELHNIPSPARLWAYPGAGQVTPLFLVWSPICKMGNIPLEPSSLLSNIIRSPLDLKVLFYGLAKGSKRSPGCPSP